MKLIIALVAIAAVAIVTLSAIAKNKKTAPSNPSTNFNVPEETLSSLEITQKEKGTRLTAHINTSLNDFNQQDDYPWECVVYIPYECDRSTGYPTDQGEMELNRRFPKVDAALKGNGELPNAIFICKIIGGNMAECTWMVHDADKAEILLRQLSESDDDLYGLEFNIQEDKDWYWFNYFQDRQHAAKSYIDDKIKEHFGDLKLIDIEASNSDRDEAMLFLVTVGYIDRSTYMQTALIDKLERYLKHIQSDTFKSEYPEPNVAIEITFEQLPSRLIIQSLYKSYHWVESNGAKLRISVNKRYLTITRDEKGDYYYHWSDEIPE